MKRFGYAGMLVLGLAIAGGCSSSGSKSSESSSSSTSTPEKVWPKAPDGTPFAKVKVEESMQEVYATIGQPTSQNAYMTGKSFIPFYYGGDTHRMEAHYKDQGRIIFAPNSAFSGDERVIEVQYDTTERGYAD